jgi:hypothetical protein
VTLDDNIMFVSIIRPVFINKLNPLHVLFPSPSTQLIASDFLLDSVKEKVPKQFPAADCDQFLLSNLRSGNGKPPLLCYL